MNAILKFLSELFSLNESQDSALRSSQTNVITSVHGPPGTGKTLVSVVIIIARLWINILYKDECPMLVTAQTNVAVDNLLKKFHGALKTIQAATDEQRQRLPNNCREVMRTILNGYLRDAPSASKVGRLHGSNFEVDPQTVNFIYSFDPLKGIYSNLRLLFTTVDMVILKSCGERSPFGKFKSVLIDEASCLSITKFNALRSCLDGIKWLTVAGDENQLGGFIADHMRAVESDEEVTVSDVPEKQNFQNFEAGILAISLMDVTKAFCSGTRTTLHISYRGPSGLYDYVFNNFYSDVRCAKTSNARPRLVYADSKSAVKRGESWMNEGHVAHIKREFTNHSDEEQKKINYSYTLHGTEAPSSAYIPEGLHYR